MKVAVIGAGAIGNLVAGYLKDRGEDVSIVANPASAEAIKETTLQISGVRGNFAVKINASIRLDYKPELVILATKTQDIERAFEDNLEFIRKAFILTTQNGIRADDIASRFIPKENIISSIIMFGSTYLGIAKVAHNFEGSWIIGKAFGKNDNNTIEISQVLNKAFPAIVTEDIKGMKMLKIFVNANNCIPAILGLSMQEAFGDIAISRIAMEIWREGLEIIKKCNIKLVSLPDFPLERLEKLACLPIDQAAKIYSGIMLNLSKEPLYGSILQSIKRGRPSEIDYINGEFLNLAKENKMSVPLNAKLVEMVHRVEKTGRFFSKEELINGKHPLS